SVSRDSAGLPVDPEQPPLPLEEASWGEDMLGEMEQAGPVASQPEDDLELPMAFSLDVELPEDIPGGPQAEAAPELETALSPDLEAEVDALVDQQMAMRRQPVADEGPTFVSPSSAQAMLAASGKVVEHSPAVSAQAE